MAVLSTADRNIIWQKWMEDCSSQRLALPGLVKDNILAAINAADSWADSNAVSYNSALPLPARTSLTAKQKADILLYVIRRRFEVS